MERLTIAKYLVMFLFTLIVVLLSIKAVRHLTNEPISTTFQFRFGDDHQGNLNLMAMTICPGQFIKHKNVIHYSLLEYNTTLPNLAWNVSDILKIFRLGGDYSYIQGGEMDELWNPILDWKYGQCYTFDPEINNMTKVPLMAANSISDYLVQQIIFDVSFARNRGHVLKLLLFSLNPFGIFMPRIQLSNYFCMKKQVILPLLNIK